MFIECRHIMPRGVKCRAAALRDRPYCYFHEKLHDYTRDGLRDDKGAFCLPSLEDACGIQMALMQIMGSMANGRLGSRRGARLLYGLQMAVQALDRVSATPPQEIVQATECDGIGVDIADQEAGLCEPHEECRTCVNRFGCENVARQNKESFRHLVDEGRDRRERAEREPLALPAAATDSARDHDESGPDERELVREEEKRVLPCGEEEQALVGKEEQRSLAREEAVPLAAASCAEWSPVPYGPIQEFVDPQKEAALEAMVNRFRPNKREADRIAREHELARMLADHEIDIDDLMALPEGSMEMPIPKSKRGMMDRAGYGP